MKRAVLILAAVVLLGVVPEADAHVHGEVKAGKWRPTGDPQCDGYNLHLYTAFVEQNREDQSDEYRFSQFGDRVVVTGLKHGRPRITVLGEVSEEHMHFEILESATTGTFLSVYVAEILEDEEELEYTYWVTAYYADARLLHCTGLWLGSTCSGEEYITGVPNFREGYGRFSVECSGTLEWVGH